MVRSESGGMTSWGIVRGMGGCGLLLLLLLLEHALHLPQHGLLPEHHLGHHLRSCEDEKREAGVSFRGMQDMEIIRRGKKQCYFVGIASSITCICWRIEASSARIGSVASVAV